MFKDVLDTYGTGWRHHLLRNLELVQGHKGTASILSPAHTGALLKNRAHPGPMAALCTSVVRVQDLCVFTRVVSSTPVRRPSGATPQGLPSSMKTPLSARRMSVLPTPASRRLSGFLLMAPQSMPRALVSPLCVPARRLSSEPRRRSTVR